jgi:hypothetical protein
MGETHTVGTVAKVEHEEFDALSMHVTPETAAEFGMPDDGSGDKKVYRIVESEREEVPEENWGVFYSNECYIVSYMYETPKGKPESYVYYWLGNSAGTAAETATAFQVRLFRRSPLRLKQPIICWLIFVKVKKRSESSRQKN